MSSGCSYCIIHRIWWSSCLQEKTKEIEKKRAIVMEDLGKVEPAVKEAQNGEWTWQQPVCGLHGCCCCWWDGGGGCKSVALNRK